MSAGKFVKQAARSGHVPSKGLTRYDHCTCHPRAWGLKKGLRRARRRLGRDLVRLGLLET